MMSSCDVSSKSENIGENTNDSLNLVSFAQNFKIYPLETGYKLVIKYSSTESEYYLFNDTATIPGHLPQISVVLPSVNHI